MKKVIVSIGLCWALSTMLVGCGGGRRHDAEIGVVSPVSPETATGFGRATLSIKWPERGASRLFPTAANSLRLTVLLANGDTFTSKVVPRPADTSVPTVVRFDALPTGELQLQVNALPNADGTGVAQAFGSTPLVIEADKVTDFGVITMQSTIDRIAISPATLETTVGRTLQPGAYAQNTSNQTVLMAADKLRWESSNEAVAKFDAQGRVTTYALGTTTITVTDTESGKSASKTLTVYSVSARITATEIPFLTRSLVYEVFQGGSIRASYPGASFNTVTGGTSVQRLLVSSVGYSKNTTEFRDLPNGVYQVQITASAADDGTGTPVGLQAGEITVQSPDITTTNFALGNTIYRIGITPTSATIRPGQTLQMVVNGAYDYSGAKVPTTSSAFTWLSSDSAVASVNSNAGLVAGNSEGSAALTVTEYASRKTATAAIRVTNVLSPQFNPRDPSLGASGSLDIADGGTYRFDTGATDNPILVNASTNAVVATGRYVTQTFGSERASVTYAVFAFTGNIHFGNASRITATGNNPLVLLTQEDALFDTGAVLDVAAGGGAAGMGPGAGRMGRSSPSGTSYGGGGFGGRGGYTSGTYGIDFAGYPKPHLQGGSGGYNGGAGGGALYIGASGVLGVHSATIRANGSDGATGGSGGGIALFGLEVYINQSTISANGGQASGAYSGGGGGGRIVVGYGVGNAPNVSQVTVAGGAGAEAGSAGVKVTLPFDGF